MPDKSCTNCVFGYHTAQVNKIHLWESVLQKVDVLVHELDVVRGITPVVVDSIQ